VLLFDSMRKQSEIMNESISPCSEGRLDVPESPVISNLPNVPPGSKHHFSKERFVELLSCMEGNLHHVLTVFPSEHGDFGGHKPPFFPVQFQCSRLDLSANCMERQ